MPRKKKKNPSDAGDEMNLDFLEGKSPVAKMSASVEDKEITSVELDPTLTTIASKVESSINDLVAESASSQSKSPHQTKSQQDTIANVERIWSMLESRAIDLKYATVGYAPTGAAVLDHDILVTLLINYGFDITSVLAFIDDFIEATKDEVDAPIIMINSHVNAIYENVKPFKVPKSSHKRDSRDNDGPSNPKA